MATFTEKELRIYEAEIRKKPLAMLRDELLDVINDPTPERQNIVKARIEALEDRERRIAEAEQKKIQAILDQPQPMPDKSGLILFLLVIAFTFGILFIELFPEIPISSFFSVRFLTFTKFIPAFGIFFLYTRYIPIFRTIVWEEKDPPNSNDVPDYWLRNFKLALSIASYFFFFSIETFVRGYYNGFFYSPAGLPAYIIGAIYLISSILFIANTFYPLSKKFRPKYGLTLLAIAAATEAIVNAIFS
jgi:hypothetical protein